MQMLERIKKKIMSINLFNISEQLFYNYYLTLLNLHLHLNWIIFIQIS